MAVIWDENGCAISSNHKTKEKTMAIYKIAGEAEKEQELEVTFELKRTQNGVALWASNNKGQSKALLVFYEEEEAFGRHVSANMEGIETDSIGRIVIVD